MTPGAAGYVMPSFEPPEPLTHLWLLPTVQDGEGLRWTHATGWAFLGPGTRPRPRCFGHSHRW